MMIIFICAPGSRAHGEWRWLDRAGKADIGVSLAEVKHPCLKKILSFCSSWTPVYIHPSLYKVIKERFSLGVRGFSRDG